MDFCFQIYIPRREWNSSSYFISPVPFSWTLYHTTIRKRGGDKNMPLPLFQPFFPVLPDKFVFPSFSSPSSSSDVRWREFAYAERRRGERRDIIIQTPSSSSSSFSACVCMGKEEDEREEGKRRLSKCDPLFFLSFPFPALCTAAAVYLYASFLFWIEIFEGLVIFIIHCRNWKLCWKYSFLDLRKGLKLEKLSWESISSPFRNAHLNFPRVKTKKSLFCLSFLREKRNSQGRLRDHFCEGGGRDRKGFRIRGKLFRSCVAKWMIWREKKEKRNWASFIPSEKEKGHRCNDEVYRIHVVVEFHNLCGCTEKPDTVRYADTVRYRTDSRGRFSISRGGITVLASTVNRTREGGFLYTLAYKEGGNRAS